MFFSITVWSFEIKVDMKVYGRIGIKIHANKMGQIIKMAAILIYGKIFKKLPSRTD